MAALNMIEEDLISLDEVKLWKVEALKDYCRKRSYKTTGTKDELCARVYFLYNKQVPEDPTAAEELRSRRQDYKSIYSEGPGYAVDPERLKKWESENEAMSNWPPVSYIEISKYIQSKGCSITKEALTTYKTGKAFSLFFNNYLQDVFYHEIRKDHPCCYLKAQCKRSNRVNEPNHNVWVKVVKESGEICSAYCSCFAGLTQVCNHVAAIMFKLESAFRLDISNRSCTGQACSWNEPSDRTPTYMTVEQMKFVKPIHKKGISSISSQVLAGLTTTSNFQQSLLMDHSSTSFQNFITDLKANIPNAVIFLPGNRMTEEEHCKSKEDIYNIMKIAEKSCTVQEFIKAITLTTVQIREIEQNTRGQASNPLWKTARQGRITASNFYKIYTRVETLKSQPHTDMSSLVNSILNPPELGFLPQIIQGKKLESKAVEAAISKLKKSHKNVTVQTCGLFIHREKHYLGSSPDGIINCSCHGQSLLEVKCPTKDISELPYLSVDRHLLPKTGYYGQVQGQMLVTNIPQAFFFVYSHTDVSTSVMEFITFDKTFGSALLTNLELFYLQHIVPKLLLEPLTKITKLAID